MGILKWARLVVLVGVSLAATDVLAAQILKLFPRIASQLETKYWVYSPWFQHTFYPYVDKNVPWPGGDYRIRTNALGFKDRAAREIPQTSNQYRILVIGDSFAEGQGLSWEDSAVGRIAAKLEPEGIEVLNAGTFHTTVPHYRNKVRHIVERKGVAINHVVVFLDVSDIPESLNFDIAPDGRIVFPNMRETRLKYFLKTNSIVMRTIAVLRDLAREPTKNTTPRLAVDVYDSDWTVNPEKLEKIGKPGIETCRKWLDDLRIFLGDRGIGLTLVVYPWATQLWHDDRDSIQRRTWKDWADGRKVQFIDLFPDYFGEDPAERRIERWYFPHDVHFNAAGSALMATGFLARFQRDGGMPAPAGPR